MLIAEVATLEEEQRTSRGLAKVNVTKRLKVKNKEVNKLKAKIGSF